MTTTAWIRKKTYPGTTPFWGSVSNYCRRRDAYQSSQAPKKKACSRHHVSGTRNSIALPAGGFATNSDSRSVCATSRARQTRRLRHPTRQERAPLPQLRRRLQRYPGRLPHSERGAMLLPYGLNKLLSTPDGTAKVRDSHPAYWGGANAGFGWVAPERVRYNQRLIV